MAKWKGNSEKKEKGNTEKGIESIRFREREQGIDEKVKAKKKWETKTDRYKKEKSDSERDKHSISETIIKNE